MNLITGSIAWLTMLPLAAQDITTSPHILPGPAHTLLMVEDLLSASIESGKGNRSASAEQVAVFRADGSSSEFKKIGVAAFPASAAEMERKLGKPLSAQLIAQLKVGDAESAYRLLQRQPAHILGPLLFSPDVLETLGIIFVDRTRDPTVASRYRIEHAGPNGETLRRATAYTDGILPDYSGRYAVKEYLVSDSTASVSWHSVAPLANQLPIFANVYRRMGQAGSFELVERVFVAASEVSDSSWVHFSETLPQARHLAYYMQLEDFAGNRGPASDTLYAIAFDVAQLSGIANLQVTDTSGGLLLTWDPLPRQAMYSAIQILKSRQLGADYITIDTISAWETAYLDEAVIPASSYYYKLRPLLYNLAGAEPLNFAEANGHKSTSEDSPLPVPPRDVSAELTRDGVKVSWQHGDELNLFGYYVLRGPSAANLEVISQPVQDTVFIDSLFSPGFSGQLHYAIQVVDLSQRISDTSDVVSVAISQPVVLTAPGGLQARRYVERVALQWENTMLRDDAVEGFAIYRRTTDSDTFEPLLSNPLRLPFFSDTTATPNKAFEYAVTSVDSWGNQSILSPTVIVEKDQTVPLSPPIDISLRNLSAGIEVSWPKPVDGPNRTYAVYRKQPGEEKFIKMGDVVQSASFMDIHVAPGTLYEYAVRVLIGSSESDLSIAKSVRRRQMTP